MRYFVEKSHDGMGAEFMGHNGPKPIVTMETDDFSAAYHEIRSHGGYVVDREERTITDRNGERCSFHDAGYEIDGPAAH